MDHIIDTIKNLMERRQISASEFADMLGVKKANVSHVLSGRNKPSLEFVVKFCEAFEEVDPKLLLFPEANATADVSTKENSHSEGNTLDLPNQAEDKNPGDQKSIERIVVFYKDKTFEEYKND